MKNQNMLSTLEFTDTLPEETTAQLMVKPFFVFCTAILLVAWVWLGAVIIG